MAEVLDPQTPIPEKPQPRPLYFAAMVAVGQVVAKEKRAQNGQVRTFYHLRFPDGSFLFLPRVYRGRSLSEWLGRTVKALYWPRTDAKGRLERVFPLGRLEALEAEGAKERPILSARGRLAFVDREEGRFGLEVRPNPQGQLKAPFTLVLWASLHLLEALPPVGSGVFVEGEARLKTRRLVVRRVEPASLWDDV